MRVLFVSPEIYPLAKTGGLADVSAALPLALAALGCDVRVVLPGYPRAIEAAVDKAVPIDLAGICVAGAGPTHLIAARTPDTQLPIWLVDCPAFFERAGGPYQDEHGSDWPDNAHRFALLSHVAARLALGDAATGWRADVVHANDWHTGLLPMFLAARGADRPATVFTLHNLAFQGLFSPALAPELGIPASALGVDGMEFYGNMSFLKAGIRYSDQLTTVSPSYAREILTPAYGCGLDGLLRERADDLVGILNGADYRIWDPAIDPHLLANFSATDVAGKRHCKQALQEELGLEIDPEAPLVAYMSRITGQKMADVVAEVLPALFERGVQLAILGEGDHGLEERFQAAARTHPRRLAVHIGYQEPLAHRLQAGADMLLHPSRFEPCGLTQLYAMRYGTVPIATRTGGLADTIVDPGGQPVSRGTATGFTFARTTSDGMIGCLDRALACYRHPVAWRKLQREAMAQDFGWRRSARRYLGLYRDGVAGAAVPMILEPDRVSV
jgi:starch synthase